MHETNKGTGASTLRLIIHAKYLAILVCLTAMQPRGQILIFHIYNSK